MCTRTTVRAAQCTSVCSELLSWGSPWSSSAGTKDVSSFESSLAFKAAFLHESCFGFDSKNFTQNTTFHSALPHIFAGGAGDMLEDETCLWGCTCLHPLCMSCLFHQQYSSWPSPVCFPQGFLEMVNALLD